MIYVKKHSKRFLTLSLVLVLVALLSVSVLADPNDNAAVPILEDSYTDLGTADTNYNNGLLFLSNSTGGPGDPDNPTKRVYLKLDLSGVGFGIAKAGLGMATLTCDGSLDIDTVANINIFGVNDVSWTESAITWNNQPGPDTAILATIEAPPIVADTQARYKWTDLANGPLAQFLETKRGGDATIMLEIADGSGLVDVSFEDVEATGAGYGCPDAGPDGAEPPLFRVATADDTLNVTLTSLQADTPTTNWALYVGLAGLAVLVLGAVGYGYSRTR